MAVSHPPPFDAADRKYAAEIQATLTAEDIASAYARVGVAPRAGTALCDFIVPLGTKGAPMMGSTDVGDVSWVVPTVQARVATCAIGTPGHSWQITAQGKSGQAKKGMVTAAKVMAGVAVDALEHAALIARAKADLKARAESAYQYLVETRKLPREQFLLAWYGEDRPIAPNDSPEGRALNRRVVIEGEVSNRDPVRILDTFRQAPEVRVAGAPVRIDEHGRFAAPVPTKSRGPVGNDAKSRTRRVPAAVPSVVQSCRPDAKYSAPRATVSVPRSIWCRSTS